MPLAKASRRSATLIFRIRGWAGRVPAPTRMFEYAMTLPPEALGSDGVPPRRSRNLYRLLIASRHEPLADTIAQWLALADHKSARGFSFMRLFLRTPWNQGLRQAGVHRQRKRAMNADALGGIVDLGLGLNLPRQHECQKPRAESLP